MPPTTGHWQLIQFAKSIALGTVEIILNTQPHEPMVHERVKALLDAIDNMPNAHNVHLIHYNKVIEQNPNVSGFWETWKKLMQAFGAHSGDYIIASEPYGQKVAELFDGIFMPYDLQRELNPAKATYIRKYPESFFDYILPEFSKYIRTTITVFGAESTGKTTLSKQLGYYGFNAHWLYEYARQYLENTKNIINTASMTNIWKGQLALQKQVDNLDQRPVVIQDTDLFSTIGYWKMWESVLGKVPQELIHDALTNPSDLYIVTPSNIPFEPDPLRYGGNKRESDDQYWINLLEEYRLPYVILETEDRLTMAIDIIEKEMNAKLTRIAYDRKGL